MEVENTPSEQLSNRKVKIDRAILHIQDELEMLNLANSSVLNDVEQMEVILKESKEKFLNIRVTALKLKREYLELFDMKTEQ
ncbi:hypothetical protein K7432_010983 [Basidiobolus ranarum]|uniref:Uncharacterized protein n=1 Tax=Basidiobolus ranarum TaxID=34480 RepID=A0ABR2WN32_9FUNG